MWATRSQNGPVRSIFSTKCFQPQELSSRHVFFFATLKEGDAMELTKELDLIQSLQNMISQYMGKNPQLTVNALAARSNVPVTSLRRLINNELKNEIAPHSVLNLVTYMLREKNLVTLLEKVEPPVAEFLRKHFGAFIFNSQKNTYNVDLNLELRDQVMYLIYKMAANHNGVDFMTVVENFGALGKRKADEMKQKGLLLEEEGRLHAREKNFSLDLSIAASHLPGLVSFYKPDTMTQGLNSMFSMSEALKEEAILELKALQRECAKKMNVIFNDPNNFGEIPYFTLSLAETMLGENNPGDLQ